MEKHKSLYKDQHSDILPPRQHSRLNRELQKTIRNKQRQERYLDSRNIQSHSPTPRKAELVVQICPEGKENENTTKHQKNEELRIVKIVCNTTNPQKLSKQEAYIKRFIEWKANKKLKDQQQEKANKKKPFLTAVSNSRQTSNATIPTSIVPEGHHEEFRPPIGLKMPKEPQNSPIKGRQSIYTIVPTPPSKSKQTDVKCLQKYPIARKALPTNLHTKITNSSKTPKKANIDVLKSVTKTKTANTMKNTPAVVKKHAPTKTDSEMPTSTSKFKPKALKMPPPPLPAVNAGNINSIATSAKRNGAVGKIKRITTKRAENMKQSKMSPLKSGGARLAQNLKAKKPLNRSKKLSSIPALQLNGKSINLNQFINNQEEIEDMIIQTPKDFATLNPYENFVTSTKLRSSGRTLEEAGNKHLHDNASAKRNIMQHASNKAGEALSNKLGNSEKTTKKYNFLINPVDANTEKEVEKNNTEEVNLAGEDKKTPTKYGPEERPNNYLSPFVSVNRGKVSLKKETEKRNSMYLQSRAENKDSNSETLNPFDSSKNTVEVLRTLEAVRYFRHQLQDEIDRLHKLCDVWEEYKKINLEKIQNANGEDMINVAIGQTRLLTSKKFMQFKGLIDRCESGVTGVGAVADDGSENTKPITSVDLEGFWSMLGLQVDNLNNRFETLNRWKSNDWVDPDEIKVKIKKNLTKVKKPKTGPAAKAKPNAALQQMLRKMHAEMRKNKTNNEVTVLSSSKQRRSNISNNCTPRNSMDNGSTSRRMSIVVKDRKYFSPAATVISVSSSYRRTSLQRKSSQDSPKMLKHVQKFNEALDTMETSINLRKSVLLNGNALIGGANENIESANCTRSSYNSPVASGRKSILKTPGTARSRLKNVIFNAKLRVKKFNFLVDEDGDDALNAIEGVNNDSHEEDLPKCHEDAPKEEGPQRTLTLRNRKVRLRPSSEIDIPVKQVGL